MELFRRLRNMFMKDYDTLGQIALINQDDSVSIFRNFDDAIKMLNKDPIANKTKIEKLKEARINFGIQKKTGAGAIRINDLGEITEYKSIEDLKKDII